METAKQIIALGIGHNTPVFIDLAKDCGWNVTKMYHYNDGRTGQRDHGFPIMGSFNDLFSLKDLKGMNFLLTMGDNAIRAELMNKIHAMGGNTPTLIHPTTVISRFATISPSAVYISAFTHVQADSVIEEGTVLLSGVNISHTNSIGRYCFVAGGATVGAYTRMEDYVFIGQDALTISGKVSNIGQCSYIGARALVTKDVPPYAVMAGSPARLIRINNSFKTNEVKQGGVICKFFGCDGYHLFCEKERRSA